MQKVSLKAGADYYVPILHQWSGAQWVVMAAHLSLLSMMKVMVICGLWLQDLKAMTAL
jgi:hypothetical protein